MKILIYGLNFYPEMIGIGKYTGELAAWLVNQGNEVRVVTAPPYYPQWKVQTGYKSWRHQRESWMGVDVFRCPLWVPQKPSGIKRILHLLSFSISSFPTMVSQIRWKPEIVLNIVPTLFSSGCSILTARISNAKSWLHIQDFELDAANSLGMLQTGNFISRIASKWEKQLLSRFDIVSTISNRMISHLIAKGVAREKTVLFPNWIDTKTVFPINQAHNPYREELSITPNQIVVLYSGNMGNKQGLEIILEVAQEMLADVNVIFLLCGNGTARPELEKKARLLSNIHFLDLQPSEKLNQLLNSANIHLLPQQANAADLVMPSKLLGMLASGKPVIATANEYTELADVIQQIGIVVPPDNREAIIGAIKILEKSPDLCKELGHRSRQFVCSHWDKEHVLTKFQEIIKTITS